MTSTPKTADEPDQPAARSKLARLLQTEGELDEMLREARREADSIVAAAHADGQERVQQAEKELEAIERAVRERVERERDEAIAGIRSEARQRTRTLQDLDEEAVATLAKYVIDRLLGGSPGGEP